MEIIEKVFGKINGIEVKSYTLINDNEMSGTFLDMGGTAYSLIVGGRDIILQYKELPDIYENHGSFDVIVARNANRIADATANISGIEYKITANNGTNNLHSGTDYFCMKHLDAKTYKNDNEVSVEFSYKFKDMEQGFPGNMDFKVRYTITNDNEFKIQYEGISDKDTIFNPTWHGYFNLLGHEDGDLCGHNLKMYAKKYTAVDENLIPKEVVDVSGTAFDFTEYKEIEEDIDSSDSQIKLCSGYDHNFVIDDYDGSIKKVCEVVEEKTGILMEVFTDCPGVQFYTGNGIHYDKPGKHDKPYVKRGGFCLETQYFPNSINDDRFVKPLIKAGEKKILNTIYKFSKA